MNRRFVKGLPLFVTGFEVEVEMTIKALERGFRLCEKPACLRDRPAGSHSKIRKFRDGYRILWTIFALMRDYKPMTTFGTLGAILMLLGLVLGMTVVQEYVHTGLVLRLPSAVLAVGLVLSGMLGTAAGMVLHTINRRFQEIDHLVRARGLKEGRGRARRQSRVRRRGQPARIPTTEE